mmetsp:Transcript_3751/g.9820  ORF Transcript_3751/g.9820 Transcript_3751/m.9820 type:complete len:220 (-) Transcript_3751:227-886(-)
MTTPLASGRRHLRKRRLSPRSKIFPSWRFRIHRKSTRGRPSRRRRRDDTWNTQRHRHRSRMSSPPSPLAASRARGTDPTERSRGMTAAMMTTVFRRMATGTTRRSPPPRTLSGGTIGRNASTTAHASSTRRFGSSVASRVESASVSFRVSLFLAFLFAPYRPTRQSLASSKVFRSLLAKPRGRVGVYCSFSSSFRREDEIRASASLRETRNATAPFDAR